jgi:hypothetical protein
MQDRGWDLVIGSPPSVFQCDIKPLDNSVGTDYTSRINETISTFQRMHASDSPFEVIKQSTDHPTARTILSKLDNTQQVYPWQHGNEETNAIHLYIKGALPLLLPTCNLTGRVFANKSKDSKHSTGIGIATAMATQWIPTLLKHQTDEANPNRNHVQLTATEMINP